MYKEILVNSVAGCKDDPTVSQTFHHSEAVLHRVSGWFLFSERHWETHNPTLPPVNKTSEIQVAWEKANF